jgi:hypothetical protein
MENLNHALDGVCWRYPDGLVSLQTSVFIIFGGLAVSQKRIKKTRQTESEDSWANYNSERLSVLEYVFKINSL